MFEAITRSAGAVAALIVAAAGSAQTLDPVFADDYSITDLGSVTGVPTPYGGVTFKYDDPDTLLLGGAANGASGAIYAVPLERGCEGQIVGFAGEATLFATAPNIDGGLAYGPDNILFFTTYSNNTIGQILPGGTSPEKTISLTPLGIASSTGTLAFAPEGFAGAGSLKIASYNASTWYDASVVPDGKGTYDIVDIGPPLSIGGGPEGIVYIGDNNPQFDADSVLISEYSQGRVSAYEIDGQGDPIVDSRRTVITGLSGAEGAAIDPVTGEFVFSTFGGGNRVILVRGFAVQCPANIAGGDDDVNVTDLLALLAAWGQECVDEDVDDNGVVGVSDLLLLLGQWGACD